MVSPRVTPLARCYDGMPKPNSNRSAGEGARLAFRMARFSMLIFDEAMFARYEAELTARRHAPPSKPA